MDYLNNYELLFNARPSTIMHIDLNSCFASVEQQANPHLRGKPIAVASYATPSGCILAPSVEAKRWGVGVGMRVKEGKVLCPSLIVLAPDPWKYRNVHLKLRKLLQTYTDDVTPKSIDEFVLNLAGYPAFGKGMLEVGREIKKRIKQEIGDWLTVSIGIAPNRFLAKTAAGLRKPDGLDEISKNNFQQVYADLKLQDLCGIKTRNAIRLNSMGIYTVLDFYSSPIWKNRAAFGSILGYYWYLRLRGWEIDDVIFVRRSYSNSYALPYPLASEEELAPILQKLVQKMGMRLRKAGYKARGVHLAIVYRDGSYWHKGMTLSEAIFDSKDIYKHILQLLMQSPGDKAVRNLAVACFDLSDLEYIQLDLFENTLGKKQVTEAVDGVNERWGSFSIIPARMMGIDDLIVDRIAFGGIKELEEFTTG